MLAKTSIKSLVILIDDLDRCLPDRIVETLEAIKLFVAVPKTAFVIGADPRIVRHAIGTRYRHQNLDGVGAGEIDENDLIKDYLEKLIQIPYHLPRLSPAEMETYINLLLCHKYLPAEQHKKVLECAVTKRGEDYYTAFTYGDIGEALKDTDFSPVLSEQLAWSN